MIDELKCLGCQFYEEGWCKRCKYGEDLPDDVYMTREGITVTIYDSGLWIPVRDIIRCNLNC